MSRRPWLHGTSAEARLTSWADLCKCERCTWNLRAWLERENFARRFRLRSSASVFLAPGIWPISNSRPRAWAQEATFSRKKLSGKAVVKSLLMEA